MKIRTLEELSDRLTEDLAWRKKELAILLSAARKRSNSEIKHKTMIRSAITVLYAHWEGYIKDAATCYLNFISRRRLPYKNLQDSFCALSIQSEYSSFLQTQKFEHFMKVANFFLNRLQETSNVPTENAFSTKSNLDSKVLKEIITILSLDYKVYLTKEKMIDHRLLYYRNNIAHGKELYPEIKMVEELYHEIINLMNIFKNQIENAASLHKYRKGKSRYDI